MLLGRKGRFSRPDVGLDWPVDGLDRQARCRAALARGALMVAEVGGGEVVIRPALGPCRERRVSRCRRREACGLEVQERPVARLTCAWPGVVERGRGTRIGRLGIHHQPTLGHPVVAQLKTLIAGVVSKTRPTVHREGLRDDLCDRAHGGGKACDQAAVAEVGGMVVVVQLRVGAQIPWGGACGKAASNACARAWKLSMSAVVPSPLFLTTGIPLS